MKYKVLLVLALCVVAVAPVFAEDDLTITVNCAVGQSLSGTLSRLNKLVPTTLFVKGTCTEYVTVNGFTSLTLKALPGAALQQPSTNPGNGLAIDVLLIEASRSITVDGFAVHTGPSAVGGIGIGRNSIDVQLRNVTVDGPGAFGFFVFEGSQVSLAGVTARDLGYGGVGVFDVSDVHIESSLFENSTVGFQVNSGHITVQSTTIRNMYVGINIATKGDVDIQGFSSYYPVSLPNDVVIESPAGTNHQGVKLEDGSHLNLGDTKLRITNAGQPGREHCGGLGLRRQHTERQERQPRHLRQPRAGHLREQQLSCDVGWHHHYRGQSWGFGCSNLSSISIGSSNPQTLVGGNATDVFCDSRSLITGGANLAGVPVTKCSSVLQGDSEPLP